MDKINAMLVALVKLMNEPESEFWEYSHCLNIAKTSTSPLLQELLNLLNELTPEELSNKDKLEEFKNCYRNKVKNASDAGELDRAKRLRLLKQLTAFVRTTRPPEPAGPK